MKYLLCVLIGYALGCINPAYIFGRIKGFDIREQGSHNAGASNSVILLGWPTGILVALLDFGKAALAYFICGKLFNDLSYASIIGGVAAIYGHCFPFYLGFRGGKGTATFIGLMLISNWKYALICLAILAAITLITKFIAYGTFFIIAAFPIILLIIIGWQYAIIMSMGSILILMKHRINIKRLKDHTEIPLSFGKHD